MRNRKYLAMLCAVLIVVIASVAAGICGFPTYTLYAWKISTPGPMGNLIWGPGGTLYGTTYNAAFELQPKADGTWAYHVIHYLTASFAGLVSDASGNLYGTTGYGGAYNQGTVFRLRRCTDGNWTESVLHSFTGGADGANPHSALILDSSGNLYGTTEFGGKSAGSGCEGETCGVVFELAHNPNGTWTESVLHSFTGYTDGAWPVAGLVSDAAGNLYGTTLIGTGGCGGSGCGTVYRLSANPDGSWTKAVLHSFNLLDGDGPVAGLILDAAGNLYGTAEGGGNLSQSLCGGGYCGVVFKLAPNLDETWTESVTHAFNGKDGSSPQASLTFDATGNLYGTTTFGGDLSDCEGRGCGVAFKLTSNTGGTWTEIVLHRFYDTPGAHPFAGMILDKSGNLYGTTYGDGIGRLPTTFGSVFKIVQ